MAFVAMPMQRRPIFIITLNKSGTDELLSVPRWRGWTDILPLHPLQRGTKTRRYSKGGENTGVSRKAFRNCPDFIIYAEVDCRG